MISIVIVNYNLSLEITRCVRTILAMTRTVDYEIVIVDNNSTYEQRRMLQAQNLGATNGNIRTFFLEKNMGFGAGCNHGVSVARGDIVLFLNPDTTFSDDVLGRLKGVLDSYPKAGVVAPRQNTRLRCLDFSAGVLPNVLLEFFNILMMGRYVESCWLSMKDRRVPVEAGWVLGAAIMVKTELFKRIGGFDSRYFMFFEEVDFCHRLISAGYKVVYCPFIAISHAGSLSGKRDYRAFTHHYYRSKFIYLSSRNVGVKRMVLQGLCYGQVGLQLLIWTLLSPFRGERARQKVQGFVDALHSIDDLSFAQDTIRP